MYDLVNLTVEQRVNEFACDVLYSGRRVDMLLKKWHLEYRKGKSVADIQKARQLSINSDAYINAFANRLLKILKSE